MSYQPNNPNGQATMANSAPVVIASNQSAVPVSGTVSVTALPTGANTIGAISNTAFTANAGTNLNTSALALDATLTGGTQKAIARGGAKGTTVAGDLTSNPIDANTQALHVDGSKVTQPVSGTVTANATLSAETTKVIGTVNVAASQTIAVTQATASSLNAQVVGSVADAATDSGNPVKVGAKYNLTAPTYTDGQRADLQTTARGNLKAELQVSSTAIAARASNADGVAVDSGSNSLMVLNRNTIFNGTTWDRMYGDATAGLYVQSRASTTGGYTPGKLISAATTNATSIKASAGTLGYLTASNINAAARYVKIYNKATAPTVGTDVPVAVFLLPGSTTGAGTNIPLPPQGIALSAGISLAITAGATDADTTAVAASEIIVNYGTK